MRGGLSLRSLSHSLSALATVPPNVFVPTKSDPFVFPESLERETRKERENERENEREREREIEIEIEKKEGELEEGKSWEERIQDREQQRERHRAGWEERKKKREGIDVGNRETIPEDFYFFLYSESRGNDVLAHDFCSQNFKIVSNMTLGYHNTGNFFFSHTILPHIYKSTYIITYIILIVYIILNFFFFFFFNQLFTLFFQRENIYNTLTTLGKKSVEYGPKKTMDEKRKERK